MRSQFRKEPALRFAHSSSVSKRALIMCIAAAMVAGGCGYEHGWLNPAAVGRHKKEPLLKPILHTLDTGFEEPNDQFAQATEIEPEELNAQEQDDVVGKNDLLTISITDLMARESRRSRACASARAGT